MASTMTSTRAEIVIQDDKIHVSGDLVIPEIRNFRERRKALEAGKHYQLILDDGVAIDSAGLAYLVNMIMRQKKNGGDISIQNIPASLQELITLAEVDFIFN